MNFFHFGGMVFAAMAGYATFIFYGDKQVAGIVALTLSSFGFFVSGAAQILAEAIAGRKGP